MPPVVSKGERDCVERGENQGGKGICGGTEGRSGLEACEKRQGCLSIGRSQGRGTAQSVRAGRSERRGETATRQGRRRPKQGHNTGTARDADKVLHLRGSHYGGADVANALLDPWELPEHYHCRVRTAVTFFTPGARWSCLRPLPRQPRSTVQRLAVNDA